VIDGPSVERLLLRQRICNMFRRYFPARMHRLPEALERCRGREENLLVSLVARLGPEPQFTPQQQQLADVILERVAHLEAAAERDIGAEHACREIPEHSMRASPRRDRETLASAVALSTMQHTARVRIMDAYMCRRMALASDEETEREAMAKVMASEARAIAIVSMRRVFSVSHMKQLRERREAEEEIAARRQEAIVAQRIQRLASAELQRFIIAAAELQIEERTARRTEYQAFLDTAAVILRGDKHKERLRRERNAQIDQAHRILEAKERAQEAEGRIAERRRRMQEEEEKNSITFKESTERINRYVQKMRQKFRRLEEERQQEQARIHEELARRRSTVRMFMGIGVRSPSVLGTTLSETLSSGLDEDQRTAAEGDSDDDGSEGAVVQNAPRPADLLPSLDTKR
jgi:hypothetical protein